MNKANLPYILPKKTPDQLKLLAKITKIPFSFMKDAGQLELEAISGVILYRHLGRLQKIEAMSLIRQVGKKNRSLEARLIDLIIDTNVNPQWGIWSLNNEELLKDKYFHNTINSYANIIGLTATAAGAKDIIKQTWQTKKITKNAIITLAIWGALIFNGSELEKTNTEISNRSQLKSSPVY